MQGQAALAAKSFDKVLPMVVLQKHDDLNVTMNSGLMKMWKSDLCSQQILHDQNITASLAEK